MEVMREIFFFFLIGLLRCGAMRCDAISSLATFSSWFSPLVLGWLALCLFQVVIWMGLAAWSLEFGCVLRLLYDTPLNYHVYLLLRGFRVSDFHESTSVSNPVGYWVTRSRRHILVSDWIESQSVTMPAAWVCCENTNRQWKVEVQRTYKRTFQKSRDRHTSCIQISFRF